MPATIIYVGPLNTGGTCAHRLMAMRDLGLIVFQVDTFIYHSNSFSIWLIDKVLKRFGRHLDLVQASKAIVDLTRRHRPNVLWMDKCLAVSPTVLRWVKEHSPDTKIVAYSPDDMLNPNNQSPNYLQSIPIYDFHVTTKSYNWSELKELGAREVLFVDNAFAPHVHAPPAVSATLEQMQRNGVAFIGSFELERALVLENIAKKGIPLTIWGNWPKHWRHRLTKVGAVVHSRELIEHEYSYAISSFLINLNFLRKVNRDLQTTRSIEIPASGGFMLAERTQEHQALFREGIEADYFSTEEELLEKIDFYLKQPERAVNIARQARLRCELSGYSNHARLAHILKHMNIDVASNQTTTSDNIDRARSDPTDLQPNESHIKHNKVTSR